MENKVIWHNQSVTKEMRQTLGRHRPLCIWLSGLSGSGKSTIANALEEELFKYNCRTYLLDGDNIRHGLNRDLGFSDSEREENIRRVGELAHLFVDSGAIVITAFISPFKRGRDNARKMFAENEFIEVYVKCPFDECESRDPKGLYKKAKSGEIKNFTGISSKYEEPDNPDITISTSDTSVADGVEKIISFLKFKSVFK